MGLAGLEDPSASTSDYPLSRSVTVLPALRRALPRSVTPAWSLSGCIKVVNRTDKGRLRSSLTYGGTKTRRLL